jgi:hypothetical protein
MIVPPLADVRGEAARGVMDQSGTRGTDFYELHASACATALNLC